MENNKHNIPNFNTNAIPLLITKELESKLKSYGVSENEINQLSPKRAWELLQEKILKSKVSEPNKEKIYTLEEVERELDILGGLWTDAFERMSETSSESKADEIYEITAFGHDDSLALENYLNTHSPNLSPEERYFIQMSINLKKFKARAHVLLYGK